MSKLTRMWLNEFVTNGFCALCGNHGIIKISGVKTPTGVELNEFNGACICPNGRIIRKRIVKNARTSNS